MAIVVAICARFSRFRTIGKDIKLRINHFAERFDEAQEVFRQRYLTEGVGCLGCENKQFGMFSIIANGIYTLYSAADMECASGGINVFPTECADLANAQACIKA